MLPPQFSDWREEATRKHVLEIIRPHAVSELYFAEFTHEKPELTLVGDHLYSALNLIRLNDLIFRICSSKDKKHLLVKSWYKSPTLVTTPLAQTFVDFLKDVEDQKFFFPRHKLQPQIRVLIAIARRARLKHPASNFKFLLPPEFEAAAREYNDLLEKTRTALLSNGLKEKVKSFQRNSKNCQLKFKTSFHQRLEQHRKILLIGVVTGERRTLPRIHANDTDQETFERQARHFGMLREEMLKHLRKTLGKSLLFYAWKLEWGADRGWHIHWIIALNGSDYQDRIKVPFHITKEWDKIGKGLTHNQSLNGMKWGERKGYRVFNYWEPEILFHAGEIAKYLTKIDLTMKLRLPHGMRSFGCSNLLKQKNKTGPKRSYELPHDPSFLI